MFFMAGDTQLLETDKVYLLLVRGPAPDSNGGGYRVVSDGNGMHEVEILEGTGEPPGPTGNTGSGEGSENGGDTNPGPNESPGGEGSTGNTGADEGPPGTPAPKESSAVCRPTNCEPALPTPSPMRFPSTSATDR